MKLDQLMLCLDCDEVSLIADLCPACSSRTVVEVSKWIPPIGILSTPVEMKTRREALFAECRQLVAKLAAMSKKVEQPEPLGCGA